jgi:hypothetical protein
MEHITKLITIELETILFKILLVSKTLPFLMPIYKVHNKSYTWLTNVHGSIFAFTTHVFTCVLMKLMVIFKEWVKIGTNGY